jgi:hypothetical protein
VRAQMEMLEAACARRGRASDQVDKVLLQGITAEQPLRSVDALVEWAGQYQALGITEIVLHWPVPESMFAGDPDVFEKIVTEGMPQL